MQQKDKVKKFIALTQTGEQTAIYALQANDWKLDLASDNYFSNPDMYYRELDVKKIEQLFNRYKGKYIIVEQDWRYLVCLFKSNRSKWCSENLFVWSHQIPRRPPALARVASCAYYRLEVSRSSAMWILARWVHQWVLWFGNRLFGKTQTEADVARAWPERLGALPEFLPFHV